MKKLLFCIAVVVVGGLSNAATLTWSAAGYPMGMNGNATSGTAYLLQISDTNISQQDIVNYLNQYGATLDYAKDGTTVLEKNPNIMTGDVAGFINYKTDGMPNNLDVSKTVYTIVVFDDDTYALSVGEHLFALIDVDNNVTGYTVAWNSLMNPDKYTWLTGELGGDTPVDPDVPEPTALALLALGVAGVALRRRVA